MFLGSVSGTRRPEPWLSQPGDGDCFYFSLLSGVCTYIPTNSTSPDSAPISPFAVPQHKARPKTTVATGEMLQFLKRRTFVCCVFQASLNNAFCKYTAAVSWKQAIKPPPPLRAPSPLPCPPNRTQQWPCSGMWRWPTRCRLAEECRHHHTTTHTSPTQHKAPVGRRKFSCHSFLSSPSFPLLPVAVFFSSSSQNKHSYCPHFTACREGISLPVPRDNRENNGGERGAGG